MSGARTVTLALGGRWYGGYGLAFCPAHPNSRTPALSLADGRDGRLLARCHAGCTFNNIVEALRGLGISDHESAAGKEEVARCRAADRAERRKRVAQARRIWEESLPAAGTLVETYLRWRGVSGPLPDCLRFHPDCWHGPTAGRHPAMVAMVERRGAFCGIHRTYLASDGGKADLTQPKLALGICAGGAVRLSAGPGPLVLCEGIETGLSLAKGLAGRCGPVWACLGTEGLKAVELPAGCRDIVIAPDGDEPGRAAAEALAMRAVAAGVRVRVMQAPAGHDWNDVARGVAA